MTWSTIQLAEKSADLFIPSSEVQPVGVMLFLHGYDGVTLNGNSSFTNALRQQNLAAICPHGEHCWWTDSIYAPFDERQNPIEFLAREVPRFCRDTWQFETTKIGLCGIEMGGQGALQLAYRHARQFQTVVAISPKIDFETWWGHGTSLDVIFPDREAARQRTAILQLHPLNYPKHQLLLCDPADHYCIDGVLTLASKLSSTGILFDQDFETTHGGFGWNYANAMVTRVVEFLSARLRSTL